MIRPRPQTRAFMLLELMFAISVASIIFFALGKLLLDGIYLQRIAAQRANRLAVTQALTERLRADALGAVAYAWNERESASTLKLHTYADGSHRQVDWVFRGDQVVRRADDRDAGGFRTERLRFYAQIERNTHADILALELIVCPPARSRHSSPRSSSERVLLPREEYAPTRAAWEQEP